MTLHMNKEIVSVPVDGEGPASPLPMYSETDDHSIAGYEVVEAPHSTPAEYMTAEQEKASLANRDQREASKDLQAQSYSHVTPGLNNQVHSTSPTHPDIYEQPRGDGISAPVLFRGLQVPSSRRTVSSGFPYPDMLNTYGITAQEWSNFTSEITQAAQLSSKEWTVTVGASVATFCASGIFIGWLGLIPAIVVGHHLRRSAEHKNLRTAKDTGDLETKLLRWNETTFAPKGFLIRLDLPGDDSSDVDDMDVYAPRKGRCGSRCGGTRRARAGLCGNSGRWAEKAEKRAACSKRKTERRGRIVIVPINRANGSTMMLPAEKGEMMGQDPMSISEKGMYSVHTREV